MIYDTSTHIGLFNEKNAGVFIEDQNHYLQTAILAPLAILQFHVFQKKTFCIKITSPAKKKKKNDERKKQERKIII